MVQIRKRMDALHKEYNALSDAYRILVSAGSVRGRKAKIPTLQEMIVADVKVKTGKRGRPPGAKNKPGAKKPGPKPSAQKVSAATKVESKVQVSKPAVVKPAAKAAAAKVATKLAGASDSSTSVKPAAAVKKVKPKASIISSKPKKVSVKPSKSGGTEKRSRIPDLAEKIQDMVAKTGRFTTNSVITDKLSSLYPGKSRSDLGKYISVILANMKARKELSVVTHDAKGNKMRSGLWGLPTWFEGVKPKAEFLK